MRFLAVTEGDIFLTFIISCCFLVFLQRVSVASPKTKMHEHGFSKANLVLFSHHAYKRHQNAASRLDSQQVARRLGVRYELKGVIRKWQD